MGCHRERSVNCHGERPCASWPSIFCHYEHSEVIQKQVLLAMGDCFCHYIPSRVTRTASKFPRKTLISKIKTHLKSSLQNSVQYDFACFVQRQIGYCKEISFFIIFKLCEIFLDILKKQNGAY